MISAVFSRDPKGTLRGFSVSGHAGMADLGQDVCCASVSSAVMLTANTVTEAFKLKADIGVEENEISLKLKDDPEGNGDKVLLGLLVHFYNLKDEFGGFINVRIEDVS